MWERKQMWNTTTDDVSSLTLLGNNLYDVHNLDLSRNQCLRIVRRKISNREFGWGGTPVTTQHRCPKVNSMRSEISCRLQGEKVTYFRVSVKSYNVGTWPIDPLCILLADLNPQRPERSPIRRIFHKYLKKALGMNYRLRLVHTQGHLDCHSIQQIRL